MAPNSLQKPSPRRGRDAGSLQSVVGRRHPNFPITGVSCSPTNPHGEKATMGCTPSKSIATYTHERVCQDLDTCSTFVPSLKSSVSTPERPSPRLCLETASGKQTFLSVPCRDSHGRTPSQPNSPDAWSTFSTASNTNPLCTPQPSIKHSRSDSESSDCETPSGNVR